jgi:DNA polymerase I
MSPAVYNVASLPYREVWAIDFEFIAGSGDVPVPICLVGRELKTGRKIELWQNEMGVKPPYSTAKDVLFVAYRAAAEVGCHLALGWPVPERILDLCDEFKNLTNGREVAATKKDLLGAMITYHLDQNSAGVKDAMRDLVLRGGPFSWEERKSILEYCASDVEALVKLLPQMLQGTKRFPAIDLPRAIYRGRYVNAVAKMEYAGIPIDVDLWRQVSDKWGDIIDNLIASTDAAYGIYEGRSFRNNRFLRWAAKHGIPWPRLSGKTEPDTRAETFKRMTEYYPAVQPLYELRTSLSCLRLHELPVGFDGYARCPLWAYASKTGRNQPSNSEFVFGPARWIRGLIKPPLGNGLAYIDWAGAEFGYAAYASGDPNIVLAYEYDDPYLGFAVLAGAVPEGATEETHPAERARYKTCVLAVQYGQGAYGLAERSGLSFREADRLLGQHRAIFRVYWRWVENRIDRASLLGNIRTPFGWNYYTHDGAFPTNRRSLGNFSMQAGIAEMMRLTACLATENSVKLCCTVHDAFLIEAPLVELDRRIAQMEGYMDEASRVLLHGRTLRRETKTIRYPDRYMDKRGKAFFDKVIELIK